MAARSFWPAQLLDVVVDRRMTFHSRLLDASATTASPTVSQFFARGGTILELWSVIGSQSAVLAYAGASYVMMLVAPVSTPLVLVMRRPKPQRA